MRRPLLAIALVAACRAPSPPSPPPPRVEVAPPVEPPQEQARRVEVRLAPVVEHERLVALAVEVELPADPSGRTRLLLPDEWASERELWRYVEGLEITGARAVSDDGPGVRVIDSDPGATITARYRVVTAYHHEPTSNDGQPFAPIIRPEWFYAFGQALLALPEGRDGAPAGFTFSGAPEGFGFASDLEGLAARHGTIADLRDSVVMGGRDARVLTRPVGDATLRIAVRGRLGFTDDAFADMAQAIVASEREFWGEHGDPFTIVLAPLVAVPGSRSLGGTGLGDAFTIMMSDDAPLDPVRHLIAHEYFHTWNADRLGGQQDGPLEMEGKWFSEGFTELYTWRLLLRGGQYRLEDFVADWNATLHEYARSPVRNEPNRRIIADYWAVPDVGRLPYLRGPMLGAMWEQRLRRATDGARDLDDVMHHMRRAVVEAGAHELAPDAASLFVQAYAELGGGDLQEDLDRYVTRGETIELPADVLGGCLRVVTQARPVFDRGWDASATAAAGNVVTGLRKGSPAWRAGLRNGMTILARTAGTTGDATVRYVLRVRAGERERSISFFPRGEGTMTVQQVEIVGADTEPERQACARTVAGPS